MNTNDKKRQGENPDRNNNNPQSSKRDAQSGTHSEQDQPKQPMYSQGSDSPNPAEAARNAQKNESGSGKSAGKSEGNKKVSNSSTSTDIKEEGADDSIVNEQEQDLVVNGQQDRSGNELDSDEEDNKSSLNRDDFPEADDSGEQPFRKVPTMDA